MQVTVYSLDTLQDGARLGFDDRLHHHFSLAVHHRNRNRFFVNVHANTMWPSGLCRVGGPTNPSVQRPNWFDETRFCPTTRYSLEVLKMLKVLEKGHELIIRFVVARLAAT